MTDYQHIRYTVADIIFEDVVLTMRTPSQAPVRSTTAA
jgi:hypothetical protein